MFVPRGHPLYPIKLGGNVRGWDCDGCDYKYRPEGKADQEVLVWRCEKDWRWSGGEQIGAAQSVENIGEDEEYDEDLELAKALSLSLQDQGVIQSGKDEETNTN